jgi:hypothetical protein
MAISLVRRSIILLLNIIPNIVVVVSRLIHRQCNKVVLDVAPLCFQIVILRHCLAVAIDDMVVAPVACFLRLRMALALASRPFLINSLPRLQHMHMWLTRLRLTILPLPMLIALALERPASEMALARVLLCVRARVGAVHLFPIETAMIEVGFLPVMDVIVAESGIFRHMVHLLISDEDRRRLLARRARLISMIVSGNENENENETGSGRGSFIVQDRLPRYKALARVLMIFDMPLLPRPHSLFEMKLVIADPPFLCWKSCHTVDVVIRTGCHHLGLMAAVTAHRTTIASNRNRSSKWKMCDTSSSASVNVNVNGILIATASRSMDLRAQVVMDPDTIRATTLSPPNLLIAVSPLASSNRCNNNDTILAVGIVRPTPNSHHINSNSHYFIRPRLNTADIMK